MKIHATHAVGKRPQDLLDIYFLLEIKTLDDIIKEYYEKASPARTFDSMGHKIKVKLLSKNISMEKVTARLSDAVLNPREIFKADIIDFLPKQGKNSSKKRKSQS